MAQLGEELETVEVVPEELPALEPERIVEPVEVPVGEPVPA